MLLLVEISDQPHSFVLQTTVIVMFKLRLKIKIKILLHVQPMRLHSIIVFDVSEQLDPIFNTQSV